MATELVRVAAACLELTSALDGPLCPPSDEIARRVADALGSRPAPDGQSSFEEVARANRRAVRSVLVALAAEQVADPPRGSRRRASALAEVLSSGELAARIERAYDEVNFSGSCTLAADQVRRWGFDGELLLDAVVRHEAGRHLGLVWHQVNRIVANYPGYTTDELFGFGWRGLCVALHNYDPSRVSFSTYACTRICGHIADGVRAESPIPKRLNTWYRKVGATIEDLSASLGRPPTEDELAGALAANRLERELGRAATLSEIADALESERRQLDILPRLAVPAGIEEAPPVAVDEDPADAAVRELLVADVRAALGELDDDERFVIELLELEGCSIDECARRMGASTRQVRALRHRAHAQLAARLDGWREGVAVS